MRSESEAFGEVLAAQQKIQRVVDAARVVRAKLGKPGMVGLSGDALMRAADELTKLAWSIDALDAKGPRYKYFNRGDYYREAAGFRQHAVLDSTRDDLAVAYAGTAEEAERITAALNASLGAAEEKW